MTNPIDYEYFEWLISQIEVPGDETYNDLFERLHNVEFVWTVPNDDNRIADALELREEFFTRTKKKGTLINEWTSILEIVVSLSRRVAWTADGQPRPWAWHLLENLRLDKASDPLMDRKANEVDDILEALVWRTYDRDGRGGFFPLRQTVEDQTKQEIWHQMNAYVNEMYG